MSKKTQINNKKPQKDKRELKNAPITDIVNFVCV